MINIMIFVLFNNIYLYKNVIKYHLYHLYWLLYISWAIIEKYLYYRTIYVGYPIVAKPEPPKYNTLWPRTTNPQLTRISCITSSKNSLYKLTNEKRITSTFSYHQNKVFYEHFSTIPSKILVRPHSITREYKILF